MRYRCGFPEWEEDRPCDNPNEDMTCDERTARTEARIAHCVVSG